MKRLVTASEARSISFKSKKLKSLIDLEITPLIDDACKQGLVMARYQPSKNLTTEQIITICSYLSYYGYSVEPNVPENTFVISWNS